MKPSRIWFVSFLLLFTFAGTTMGAEKTEKIRVGNKEMVIKSDEISGKILTVTDEKGTPAKQGGVTDLVIMHGGKSYVITDVPDGTLIRTTGSQCVWKFYGGGWHLICSYP